MQFSGEELSAIFKMGIAMCAADGRCDDNEMVVLNNELARFGVSTIERLAISEEASKMEFNKAVSIISNFNPEQKKYVTAYLAIIMISDGEIDEKEKALWQLVSLLCNLPEMNIIEAISFIKKL